MEPGTNVVLNKNMFQPWDIGEPNGKITENCVSVLADSQVWRDVNCNNVQACSFCQLSRMPELQLRGTPVSRL
jgi:hypothetical protein